MAQHAAANLLQDHAFVDEYLIMNKKRLSDSYDYLLEKYNSIGVELIPARGGLFAFANFRKYLKEESFQGEMALYEYLSTYRGGVVMTPGKACHCQVPGYFRVCFAWVTLDVLTVAVDRVISALQHW
jgi:1-aminocyclopropane-1-carboxylate synthase